VAKQEGPELLTTDIASAYLIVNLDAVEKLAGALGGVGKIDVPKSMYYVDSRPDLYIDLYPGPQLSRGRDLEGPSLRYRTTRKGDLGRPWKRPGRWVLREAFQETGSTLQLPGGRRCWPSPTRNITTDLSPVGGLARLLSVMGQQAS